MARITLIGAGSTVFARNLIGDILSYPELQSSTISLFDIDGDRLETSRIVAERIAGAVGATPRIEATTDRRAALQSADYALCMIQVGGYEPCTVTDFEVPKRFGLRQTIADTMGIGGIMRGLRTIPVLLDLCQEMEAVCPDVMLLNYVNPMAMNMWAIHRASKIRSVGLCHSVQGTAAQLALAAGVDPGELDYLCAGINHMAFYLHFRHKTQTGTIDLYPRLRRLAAEGRVPEYDRVRYEMLERLGYFVTESSEHFAEYVPWFIKRDRPDLIEKMRIPLDEYIRRCKEQIGRWEQLRKKLEDCSETIEVRRSHEYGVRIIHSMETGKERLIYGNVANEGLIDNLPRSCCVEVPCRVGANGIEPVAVGSLPPQLAALMQTQVNVQGLTVEAALTRRREHIYHAAMMDPHTAAELDLAQIWSLVDELLDAHRDWLPRYH